MIDERSDKKYRKERIRREGGWVGREEEKEVEEISMVEDKRLRRVKSCVRKKEIEYFLSHKQCT